MKLAVVIGQVVSTVKSSGFEQERLLLVDLVGPDGKPMNDVSVATDSIGAGNGEWVLVVTGSSARKTVGNDAPIDMSVIGIVDEVAVQDKLIYRK